MENPVVTAAVVALCLLAAVLLGAALRRLIPNDHLSADTKDTVRVAMGLIATMAALLLGLLVSTAKSAYDSAQSEVEHMAAKVTSLDRVLVLYGPEATDVRVRVRRMTAEAAARMWPHGHTKADLTPTAHTGQLLYEGLHRLQPRDDMQRALKSDALRLSTDVAELRALLLAQSTPTISLMLLSVVVFWLIVIFVSFSLFAPSNPTATLALIVSAMSVAGAVLLILELDRPFDGLIDIAKPAVFDSTTRPATTSEP